MSMVSKPDLEEVADVGYDGLSEALRQTWANGGEVKVKGLTTDVILEAGVAGLLVGIPEEGIGYEEKNQSESMKVARNLLDNLLSIGLMYRDGSHVKLAPKAFTCFYAVFAYSKSV